MSRYLLQIAYACSPTSQEKSGGCDRLDLITEIIGDLGGRIEHHWRSAGEFDAVLIVETLSHGMAFDMAVAAHPAVKATKTTALRASDDPFEDYESWCGPEVKRVLADELANAGIKVLSPPAQQAGQSTNTIGD